MSNIITPPHMADDSIGHSVLIIDPTESQLDAIAIVMVQLLVDVDLYVFRQEQETNKWLDDVKSLTSAVFDMKEDSVHQVVDYLQTL